MRAGSRTVWSTIKNSLEGIEDEVEAFKEKFQAEK
jgi:hypothetical protein